MDEQRKVAYRYMLYWALLELRSFTPSGKTSLEVVGSLLDYREYRERAHWAFHYADAFHNLAEFSAKDFEGFNEEQFWRIDFALIEKFCNGGKNLRAIFEEVASGRRTV